MGETSVADKDGKFYNSDIKRVIKRKETENITYLKHRQTIGEQCQLRRIYTLRRASLLSSLSDIPN